MASQIFSIVLLGFHVYVCEEQISKCLFGSSANGILFLSFKLCISVGVVLFSIGSISSCSGISTRPMWPYNLG